MHRYLLFDSGCSQCTEIAQAVEQAAAGGLEAHSLRDPAMQRLLAQARPHWRWEPTLLEVEGERVRAFTGLALGLRLMRVLGLRRAGRLAKLVGRLSAPPLSAEPANPGRRRFLQQLAIVTFMKIWLASLVAIAASEVSVAHACTSCVDCTVNCYGRPCRCSIPCSGSSRPCWRWDCYDDQTGEYCFTFCSDCSCCGCQCV